MSGPADTARLALWLRLTGLPPPDMRGFVPKADPDPPALTAREKKLSREREIRRALIENEMKELAELFKGARWSLPATVDEDGGPGWHNAVRAYEEWLDAWEEGPRE